LEDLADFSDLLDVCRVLIWNEGKELFEDKRDQRG